MSGTSVVSGLSSGIDWRNILDQLKAAESKRVELVQGHKKTYEDRRSAWQTMNNKLLAFKTASGTLNKATGFNLYTASFASDTTTAAEDILSATTSTDAGRGTYQIKVNARASAQKLSSTPYASQTTSLNLSGDLIIGGRTVSIAATDTLIGIREKMNVVNTGTDPSKVTASIIKYGTTDYRLILTSDEEGEEGISLLNGGGSNLVETMGFAEIQAGANANITVDGVTITPSSNTVDDVITGVTLNLKKAALDTTVTLSVARDYAKVKETISGFVTAYNDVIDAINAQMTFDPKNNTASGPLFGDSTLRSIKSSLTDLIINRVSGVDENFSTLGLVGIKIGNDSKLTIDDGDLQDYLETNFDDVKRLFAADWLSTNSNLIYGYNTIDTKAGTYNINISGVDPVAGYFVTPGDATGDGEYLTGVSGDAKGLMIRYSGTATGAVGSFTLTYGVAELIDRSLYHVTDSVDGTISNKTETIQDQIKNYDEDISDLEDRIDQKMARLERQFIAMETAMSALQSQSSWLSGQLNAANSGWR
jgi:flagellar hook-associated protein 2